MPSLLVTSLIVALAPIASLASLDDIAQSAVRSAQQQFPKLNLKDEEVSVTIIDLRDPDHPFTGGFRPDAQFYPASVVKLFYLVAAEQWLEDGKLQDTPELQRGLSDMIVTSNNAACQYILDAVTGAPNGHELPPAEMEQWAYKRNAVNRYFSSMGFAHINVNQKTYIDGPYGLDKIFLAKGANSNKLTAAATARLMSEIVGHKIVTPARCDRMLKLLARNPATKPANIDDQNTSFTAKALSEGDRLWSKAGWTTTARHDVAYVETHDGLKLVLVIFTANHGSQRQLLPAIAKSVIDSLRNGHANGLFFNVFPKEHRGLVFSDLAARHTQNDVPVFVLSGLKDDIVHQEKHPRGDSADAFVPIDEWMIVHKME